jgi:CRISPR-associated protein Cas1
MQLMVESSLITIWMIKKTLYFGNPVYLKTANDQLVLETWEEPKQVKSIPIEDIGIVMLDNQQITITQALMAKLLENNVAIITCDATHHPAGILFNL